MTDYVKAETFRKIKQIFPPASELFALSPLMYIILINLSITCIPKHKPSLLSNHWLLCSAFWFNDFVWMQRFCLWKLLWRNGRNTHSQQTLGALSISSATCGKSELNVLIIVLVKSVLYNLKRFHLNNTLSDFNNYNVLAVRSKVQLLFWIKMILLSRLINVNTIKPLRWLFVDWSDKNLQTISWFS